MGWSSYMQLYSFFRQIADFGLAATLSKSTSYFSAFQGTMMYMSPERITGNEYSFPSDMWAMGMVLFSLCLGAYPFDIKDGFFGLEEAITSGPLPSLDSSKYSEDCKAFILSLLTKSPDERLSAEEALTHPFLLNYDIVQTQPAFTEAWTPIQQLIVPSSIFPRSDIENMVDYRLESNH
jgi:serine/threonine protein kinase